MKHLVFFAKWLISGAAGRIRTHDPLVRIGLVMSEAVMMGLGPHIGREYAHDLVYDICRDAVKQERPLLDLLAEHPEINKHLDRAALARLCDPANYLGQSGVMVDRVLAGLR
jgi:3-carboxy-cis,cis-muconate cycloisomerase